MPSAAPHLPQQVLHTPRRRADHPLFQDVAAIPHPCQPVAKGQGICLFKILARLSQVGFCSSR